MRLVKFIRSEGQGVGAGKPVWVNPESVFAVEPQARGEGSVVKHAGGEFPVTEHPEGVVWRLLTDR